MSPVDRSVMVVAVAVLAACGCGGSDSPAGGSPRAGQLSACVEAWNRPANFDPGQPGAAAKRLRPRPAVPQFAHLSRDRRGRCVVFLDTPSTVDDRRFILSGERYLLTCEGACGQQVPSGARTFQFGPDGSLPRP
jgi:hypothetical protein